MTSFVGTRHLIRLILRRDRVRLPIWTASITTLVGATVAAVVGLYRTPAAIAGYASTADSPATRLMSGRPDGLDSTGAVTAYEISVSGLVAVALMMTFLVVRHTRAEEETGRAELVRATVIGRHAATLATVAVATLASIVVGALDATVLVLGGLSVTGSLLHGAVLAAVGLVFTGVAAVAAQVTSSARTATGIAGAVLAIMFVIRGIGDVGENLLTWLSPLGWALMAQPYGAARWWLLVPLVALAALLLTLAAWLTAHRDAGSGILQPRPGPARARRSLGTSLGLAWRLQRGSVYGWTLGLVLGAVLLGSVGPELNDMLEANPALKDFFAITGGDPVSYFLVTAFELLAVVASAFAVSSVLRLRSEEAAGRSEALLATALSRLRWAGGSLLVTLVAVSSAMLLVGLATAGSYALASGDHGSLTRMTLAATVLAPGVLLIGAVAMLLVGWIPRLASLAYLVVVFAFVQSYLGALLDFPEWLQAFSPFDHLPDMPVEDFAATPTLIVLVLAAAIAGVGLMGLHRRDMSS